MTVQRSTAVACLREMNAFIEWAAHPW